VIRALAVGLATYLPGISAVHRTLSRAPGTESARYCYAVWMRHLVMANRSGICSGVPSRVAELGPGESIGIGLAALLSGADWYCGLDLIPFSSVDRNARVLDELEQLFRRHSDIPDDCEYPHMHPRLDDYAWPVDMGVANDLSPARIERIRSAVRNVNAPGSMVRYVAPWTSPATIEHESVDMILSQAVLEHVDNLERAYSAMREWLHADGFMSHQIDFASHGTSRTWDGHRAYSDREWALIRGRRAYLINRMPCSAHLQQMRAAGFVCDVVSRQIVEPTLAQARLAERYKVLGQLDLRTRGVLIHARCDSSGHANSSSEPMAP